MSQRRRRKNRSEPSPAESPKIKKGLSFWAWLVVTVLWCLYVIRNPPSPSNQGTRLLAKMQGNPLPDWDAERYLEVCLVALLPPILIAGAWKALKWFIKHSKIASEQIDEE